jgi:hypothetical protein
VEEGVEVEEEAVWAEVDDGRAWGLRWSANVRVVDTPSRTSLDSRVSMWHARNAELIWQECNLA